MEEEYDDIELNHLNELLKSFYETIYKEVSMGKNIAKDDVEEAIKYFANKEEFEKCIILKKSIKQ